MIGGVGDVEGASLVEGEGGGCVQLCGGGRGAVTCISGGAGAGYGADGAVLGRDFADAVVDDVGEVEIAGGVDDHAADLVELPGGGGSTVAEIAEAGVTCNASDDARGGDLEDAVVAGDVEVSRGVGGEDTGVGKGEVGESSGGGRGSTASERGYHVLLRRRGLEAG